MKETIVPDLAQRLKLDPLPEMASLKVQTYEALKRAISTMNIYANDVELRLDERSLSQQFGVSRTPLREALAQLDQEGLIRTVPRRGIYIIRKTKSEILEMITVWAALESMAARLATQVAADKDIAALHEHIDHFQRLASGERLDEYSEANIKFHQAILDLGGCSLITSITDGLFFHVRAIRQRTIVERDRAQRSLADHTAIVKAIETRDADLAERLVREHTLRLRDHVENFVKID